MPLVLEERVQTSTVYANPDEKSFDQEASEESLLNGVRISVRNMDLNDETYDSVCVAANVSYIDGLPVVVIADSNANLNTTYHDTLCNELMPKILPEYVARLSVQDPAVVMQDLLRRVNNELKQLTHRESFNGLTFSCAIAYKKDEKLKLATIGVGSDLISVYREQGDRGEFFSAKPSITIFPENEKKVDILNLKKEVPRQAQVLPSRAISKIIEQNPVTILDLQEGDEIIALNREAIASTPVRYLHPKFKKSQNNSGEYFFYRSLEGEDLESVLSTTQTDLTKGDAILVVSPVFDEAKQEKLIAQAKRDDYFRQIKEKMIQTLKERFPCKVRFFKERHNSRCHAICEAIRAAKTEANIVEILNNQLSLLLETPDGVVNTNLLDERWSQRARVKNSFSPGSTYMQAIADTKHRFFEWKFLDEERVFSLAQKSC